MKTVSKNYLEGIREGRAEFKLLEPDQLANAARRSIAWCDQVKGWYGSELHADFIAGLRDFWINQLEKLS